MKVETRFGEECASGQGHGSWWHLGALGGDRWDVRALRVHEWSLWIVADVGLCLPSLLPCSPPRFDSRAASGFRSPALPSSPSGRGPRTASELLSQEATDSLRGVCVPCACVVRTCVHVSEECAHMSMREYVCTYVHVGMSVGILVHMCGQSYA